MRVNHSEPQARPNSTIFDVEFWLEQDNLFGVVVSRSSVVSVPIEKGNIGQARFAAAVIEDWANRQVSNMTWAGACAALNHVIQDLASTEV